MIPIPRFKAWPAKESAVKRAEEVRKLRHLSSIQIFRDMTPEDMARLERMTRMATVKRGEVLSAPGESRQVLFLLKKGRVQIYRLTPDGRKLILAILGPETFFGDMPLLGQEMATTFAEAVEDATVCIMTRDDVEALILSKPHVALRILEVVGRRLLEAETRLEELAFKTVPTRVAHVLVRTAAQEDGNTIRLSHQEIAEMLGIYRETATSALDDLKKAGIVDLGRRRITILNMDALRRLAEQ